MTGRCDYCETDDVEIVRSFSSEKCSRICGDCMAQVVMMPPSRLVEHCCHTFASYQSQLARVAWDMLAQPERILSSEDLPERRTHENRMLCERDSAASRNRLRSLLTTSPSSWMPILVEPRVAPAWGEPIKLDMSYYDGVHRATLAALVGADAIPVWVRPTRFRVPTAHRVYQTLVLPDGTIDGERPPDRWRLFERTSFDGKRILDLASNAGMHGILACALSPDATYHGVDKDADAIEAGRAVAKAWDVGERVTLHVGDANGETVPWPKADTLLFLSCSKVVGFDSFMRAVIESGAEDVLVETHNMHDDPDSERILALPWRWRFLGCTAHSRGGPYVRRVFVGRPKA